MKNKITLLGLVAGAIGSYVAYKKINNHLDKLRSKREDEIEKIQSEWHGAGFNAGYELGKQDAEFKAKHNITQ